MNNINIIEEAKLTKEVKRNLIEATRRYLRFNIGRDSLTEGLTGLALWSDCSETISKGYMKLVSTPTRCGYNWLRLTDEGARLVQKWLDAGITLDEIEEHLV